MSADTLTVGQMLRKLKSSNTGSSTSQTSSSSYRAEKVLDFQRIYKNYEKGRLNKNELSERIVDDLGVNPTEAFRRKMQDHNVNFYDVIKTLGVTGRPDKQDPNYFGNDVEVASPVRSRNAEMTTISTDRSASRNELKSKLAEFHSGDMTSQQFNRYCQQANIPLNSDAQRLIRQHGSVPTLPYTQLAKSVLRDFVSSPKAVANNQFNDVNRRKEVESDRSHKLAARQEALEADQRRVGGNAFPVKRKNQPSYNLENGKLTDWQWGQRDAARVKDIHHCDHTKIFDTAPQTNARAPYLNSRRHEKDLLGAGNFIAWIKDSPVQVDPSGKEMPMVITDYHREETNSGFSRKPNGGLYLL